MTTLINDFDQVRDWDNAHFLHPWEAMEDHGRNERTFVEAASGIYVRDEKGRKLIDGPGGMWCVQIGYGREEMGRAIAEQAVNMAYYSPYSMGNSSAAELAAKIAERTPGDLNKVFFTTGGSTAVDTAIRFLHYRNNVLGKREKKIVISRQKAYHGSTYLSASVSGKERDRSWLDFANDLVHFLPDVNPYRRPDGMSEEDFLDAKVADLETAILNLGPDRVAAFIAEPILASGGVIVPPAGYHQRCLDGLPQARRALYLGRGRDRFRPSRALVRLGGGLRHHPRHHHLRQGHDLGLCADGGLHHFRPAGRRAFGRRCERPRSSPTAIPIPAIRSAAARD